MSEHKFAIATEFIKLEAFLKFCGCCSTGGEAKNLIQSNRVQVNGEACAQRGKKLHDGDAVNVAGDDDVYKVAKA